MGYIPQGHKESDKIEQLTLCIEMLFGSGHSGDLMGRSIKHQQQGTCARFTGHQREHQANVDTAIQSQHLIRQGTGLTAAGTSGCLGG